MKTLPELLCVFVHKKGEIKNLEVGFLFLNEQLHVPVLRSADSMSCLYCLDIRKPIREEKEEKCQQHGLEGFDQTLSAVNHSTCTPYD